MNKCGTNAGYMAHYNVGEPACDKCLKGHAARVAEHRAKNGRYDKILGRARSAALVQLAREHPKRFRELYEEAKLEHFAREREKN